MNKKDQLKKNIKLAFGKVDFPSHCGWSAAIAKDDWISDPKTLMQITEANDTKGEWWDIPFENLRNCSLAQCYLDAKGVEFYLPAFMYGVVDNPIRKNYVNLIHWLKPSVNVEDCNLYDYFCENFSLIDSQRKQVCIQVLEYIKDNIEPSDIYSEQEINEILNHCFWIAQDLIIK